MTLSVNEHAKLLSDAPDGSTTKASVTMLDLPAMDQRRYVEEQLAN